MDSFHPFLHLLYNIVVLDLHPTYIFPSCGIPLATKHPQAQLTDLHTVAVKYASPTTNRKSSLETPTYWIRHIDLPIPIGPRNVGHSPMVALVSPTSCNDVFEVIYDHRSNEMLDLLQHSHWLYHRSCPHGLYFLVNGGTEYLELFLTWSCKFVHINRKELYHGLRFPSFRANSQPPEQTVNCQNAFRTTSLHWIRSTIHANVFFFGIGDAAWSKKYLWCGLVPSLIERAAIFFASFRYWFLGTLDKGLSHNRSILLLYSRVSMLGSNWCFRACYSHRL